MSDQQAIDAVLDEAWLADLEARPMGDLRELRRQCEVVEERLSYLRRVLHGHLDLLRAEVARRDLGAQGPVTELLASLGEPSASTPRSPSHQRLPTSLDGIEGDDTPVSADLPDCSDDELRVRAEELVAREQHLSATRRAVLERLDRIQAEVVRRYRSGSATVDELLPGRS